MMTALARYGLSFPDHRRARSAWKRSTTGDTNQFKVYIQWWAASNNTTIAYSDNPCPI